MPERHPGLCPPAVFAAGRAYSPLAVFGYGVELQFVPVADAVPAGIGIYGLGLLGFEEKV